MCTIAVPKGEEKDFGAEILPQEILAEYSPNLLQDIDIQIQEIHWQQADKLKQTRGQNIIIKLRNIDNEKVLKVVSEKNDTLNVDAIV